MDLVLVIVTAVSLALALAMSVVAWTLIRNERQRAAARVEALEALAFAGGPQPAAARVPDTVAPAVPVAALSDDPTPHVVAAATVIEPQVHVAHVTHTPVAAKVEDGTGAHQWDFAFRDDTPDDLHHVPLHQAAPAARPDGMFGNAPAPGVAGRRWLAVAAVALLVVAGVATMSAVNSPEIVAAVAASRPAATAGGTDQPLELLSLRHVVDADGAFTVTGLVQNPMNGRELQKVEAVVYLFDETGTYFATGRANLDVAAVAPGDESPFVVHIANVSGVSRYRVGFRQGDGKVVAHVDHRGQLPAGTTGDALGVEPELAQPAAMTGRVAR